MNVSTRALNSATSVVNASVRRSAACRAAIRMPLTSPEFSVTSVPIVPTSSCPKRA
ncbi:MAG: hypothetical protein FJW29_10065, partial [Acidobacteria bacterium]|nr:hypothetical protein [Acidobacteriota bacterium]